MAGNEIHIGLHDFDLQPQNSNTMRGKGDGWRGLVVSEMSCVRLLLSWTGVEGWSWREEGRRGRDACDTSRVCSPFVPPPLTALLAWRNICICSTSSLAALEEKEVGFPPRTYDTSLLFSRFFKNSRPCLKPRNVPAWDKSSWKDLNIKCMKYTIDKIKV